MFYLQFQQNKSVLFDYKLRSRRIRIGRSDTCDIALPGEAISRLHCQLEQRSGQWILSDHSTYGTFIEGKRLKKQVLVEGDTFSLGEYVISLRVLEDKLSETTEVFSARSYEFVRGGANNPIAEVACLIQTMKDGTQKEFVLRKTQYTIGGKGSAIEISDGDHRKDQAIIYVSQGRVMVAPKAGPVFFNGQRITQITPVYMGEMITLGGVSLQVDRKNNSIQGLSKRFASMVAESKIMQEKFGQMKLFAAHDFPVLITGESGTGKELTARAIHSASIREAGPFVTINCGAIPNNLVESELFGHVKGSFSGAIADKKGAFQQADGGTLFLDELGDLPLAAQVKLLRALEGGDVRRVGSTEVEFPNVRIIAATNQNLHEQIEKGAFREDLLFRLQVLSIRLPPLRERVDDIELLIEDLCQALNPSCQVSPDVLPLLKAYAWPGNIRELRNVLSRAYVMGQGVISIEHIELYGTGIEKKLSEKKDLDNQELVLLFAKHKGNRSAMSRELGIPRTTLIYRLQQAGLS